MGWAPAEVEAGACVGGLVFAPVIQLIPGRVFREIEVLPIDNDLIDPDLARIIPAFEDRQQAKVCESGAVSPVRLHQFAGRDLIIQFERDQSTAFTRFRIVLEAPCVSVAGGNCLCLDALAARNFPDHARFAAPAARAVFEMAMESLAAAI